MKIVYKYDGLKVYAREVESGITLGWDGLWEEDEMPKDAMTIPAKEALIMVNEESPIELIESILNENNI